MKKVLFSLCILMLPLAYLGAQTMSVHLSGTITADSTGLPVTNHEVIITGDSITSFGFYASRHTNALGKYDCTIQNVPVSPTSTFVVKTLDCNNIYHQESFLSSSSPAVINFVICTQAAICEAAFTYYTDSLNLFSWHFNSMSFVPSGSVITSCDWDFGDGSTHVSTQDPWHTYATTGVYHVCLTITTSTGCTSVKCQEIHVIQGECVANFEYQADSLNFLKYHFFDTSSLPQGSTITSRTWDFGDGTAHGTTSDPWHTYAATGVYHVCLTISTSTGCTSVKCQEIHVILGECAAKFEYHRDTTNLLKFHFFDSSTLPQGSTITSRAWGFGDGTPHATTSDPWHTYAGPGEYNVCLTITTSTGCTSTWCEVVHAVAEIHNCESWMTYSSNMQTVNFEGHTHSTYPTSWTWDFGDPAGPGNSSNLQNPQHIFSSPGTYTITLHTVDSNGCEHSSTMNIFVHSTVDIHGVVRIGDHFVDHGRIDLIRLDSANLMTVVDTKEFGDSTGMYSFGGVSSGHYFLKAELLPASAFFGLFAPTYYIEALNWTGSTLIELGNPQNPYNFSLRHINGPSHGNGKINGHVSQGTKVNEGGTPAANVEVILYDGSNIALAYVNTDSNGLFEFSDLAMGEYTIWPEVAGLPTVPAHISLSAETPSANLSFSMTSSSITYGINEIFPEYFSQVGSVFPNPAFEGSSQMLVTVTHDLLLEKLIFNQSGQLVQNSREQLHKGINLVSFDLKDLVSGSYILQLRSGNEGSVNRKLTVVH